MVRDKRVAVPSFQEQELYALLAHLVPEMERGGI